MQSIYFQYIQVLKKNMDAFKTIPLMNSAASDFEKSVEDIICTNKIFQNVAKGATIQKNTAKDELIETLLIIKSGLSIAGNSLKDKKIIETVAVNKSGLMNIRGNDLLQTAEIIYDMANENIDFLKTIHTEIDLEIKELKNRIDNFNSSMNNKDLSSTESQTVRKSLDKAYENTDKIINETIDNLMEIIKNKYPVVYNEYHASRVIKDLGASRKTVHTDRLS